jgi:hypothetical protein
MREYITSLCDVAQMVNKKGQEKREQRLIIISLLISNYVITLANKHNVNLREIKNNETANLTHIFEYISYNNIELFDFKKIDVNDVDTTKPEDLERFVLTHVYYITQS